MLIEAQFHFFLSSYTEHWLYVQEASLWQWRVIHSSWKFEIEKHVSEFFDILPYPWNCFPAWIDVCHRTCTSVWTNGILFRQKISCYLIVFYYYKSTILYFYNLVLKIFIPSFWFELYQLKITCFRCSSTSLWSCTVIYVFIVCHLHQSSSCLGQCISNCWSSYWGYRIMML